jgi:ABC-type phosphate transport system ATPase subunit
LKEGVYLIENLNGRREEIDIYSVDPMIVRRKIGMVFSKAEPIPNNEHL